MLFLLQKDSFLKFDSVDIVSRGANVGPGAGVGAGGEWGGGGWGAYR